MEYFSIDFFSSVVGSAWAAAVKELMEHYTEREANYPTLKLIILESFRRIKIEKTDEYNKVENLFLHLLILFVDELQILLYNEEIIREMVEIERRTVKARRAYEDACERPRQKESGIKRFHQKILPKVTILFFFSSMLNSSSYS